MSTKEQMTKEINDTIRVRLNLPADVNYFHYGLDMYTYKEVKSIYKAIVQDGYTPQAMTDESGNIREIYLIK